MTDKRAYARLLQHFDGERSTHSAIAPLICFAFVFVVVVLLRLITIFGAVTARCVEPDQFWYTSTGGNWPLIGTFFLVLFLLFVWNAFIGFDDWRRSRGTKIMVVVNAIAIASVFFVFNGIHDSATRMLHKRMGLFDNINFRPPGILVGSQHTEDACVTAHRFAGRWRVVEREVGHYGFDIPAEWIEIKPWGYVYGQDASWSETYAGRWLPPNKWE